MRPDAFPAPSRKAQSGHTEERRIAERHPASMPSITGVRLSPRGGEASLVNISTSGALLKANVRLMPGTLVTLHLEGTFQPPSIPGRVVRCYVTDIDSQGVLWYHVGAVFNQPITLDDIPVRPIPTPQTPPRQPQETRTPPAVLKNRW